MNSGAIAARFDFSKEAEYFEIQEASKRNQKLVLGTDFTMKRLGQFELSTNVEVDIMSHFGDYSMKMKFQWLF